MWARVRKVKDGILKYMMLGLLNLISALSYLQTNATKPKKTTKETNESTGAKIHRVELSVNEYGCWIVSADEKTEVFPTIEIASEFLTKNFKITDDDIDKTIIKMCQYKISKISLLVDR